jgi:hypothetical protein
LWVINVLVGELHMSAQDLEKLSPDEAASRFCEEPSRGCYVRRRHNRPETLYLSECRG